MFVFSQREVGTRALGPGAGSPRKGARRERRPREAEALPACPGSHDEGGIGRRARVLTTGVQGEGIPMVYTHSWAVHKA